MSKFLWVSGKTPDNVLEGIRTPDPRLRRPLLYPAELRTHLSHLHYNRLHIFIRNLLCIMLSIIICKWKAGDGNRTHVSSLEGWCSTIELHPHTIGVTGFEPATSWSQTRRSSQAEPHPVFLFRIRFCITRDARIIIWQNNLTWVTSSVGRALDF